MSVSEKTMSDEVCPVCHENIEFYAIGQCNHPICYRCSVRMRILCDQMYCPICRTDLKQVAFLANRTKFDAIDFTSLCLYRDAMIFSENKKIQKCFLELLEHRCQVCSTLPGFDSFSNLKTHMSKEHNLMSCKLCTDNLKLFSRERKFYTTKDMVHHKKFGDVDDKSYKGHPLCKFCNERYFDNDALIIHLRKDHFFCHFCETAGKTGEFFCNYENLREHFRDEHYLCEEGECATVQWSNAFGSDIDLKAHVVSEHSKGLDKFQSKRLKTIDVDFSRPEGRNRPRNERVVQAQRNRQEVEAAHAMSITLAEVERQGQVKVVHRDLVDIMRGQTSSTPPLPTPPLPQNIPVPALSDFPDLRGNVRGPVPPAATESSTIDSEMKQDQKKLKPPGIAGNNLARKVGYSSKFSVMNGDFPSLPSQPSSLRASQVPMKNSWAESLGNSNKKQRNSTSTRNLKQNLSDGNLFAENATKHHEVEDRTEGVWLKKKATNDEEKEFFKNKTKLGNAKKKAQASIEKIKMESNRDAPKIDQLPVVSSLSDLTKMHSGWSKTASTRDDVETSEKSQGKSRKIVGNEADSSNHNVVIKKNTTGNHSQLSELFDSASASKSSKKKSKQDDVTQRNAQSHCLADDTNKPDAQSAKMSSLSSEYSIPCTSSEADSNEIPVHSGPPPGFVSSATRGPPPGFKPKGPPSNPLSTPSAQQLIVCPNLASDDFPALVSNGPPGFFYKKLSVHPPVNKMKSSGVWATVPEIPVMETETPEQRLTRLVLAEKDQSSLECMKLQLLKLNQGIIEIDDFYESCITLVGPSTSSVFNIIFKDIMASIKSPKDKAKLLVKHQSRISASDLQWETLM